MEPLNRMYQVKIREIEKIIEYRGWYVFAALLPPRSYLPYFMYIVFWFVGLFIFFFVLCIFCKPLDTGLRVWCVIEELPWSIWFILLSNLLKYDYMILLLITTTLRSIQTMEISTTILQLLVIYSISITFLVLLVCSYIHCPLHISVVHENIFIQLFILLKKEQINKQHSV